MAVAGSQGRRGEPERQENSTRTVIYAHASAGRSPAACDRPGGRDWPARSSRGERTCRPRELQAQAPRARARGARAGGPLSEVSARLLRVVAAYRGRAARVHINAARARGRVRHSAPLCPSTRKTATPSRAHPERSGRTSCRASSPTARRLSTGNKALPDLLASARMQPMSNPGPTAQRNGESR
jgi:hypothetical protein